MNLPDKANETCVAQIAEALFGQPGLSLLEMANRRAEIEVLVKDASRYRWLRDEADLRSRDLFNAWWMSENGHPENVEAAIDIAMAAMKEQAE